MKILLKISYILKITLFIYFGYTFFYVFTNNFDYNVILDKVAFGLLALFLFFSSFALIIEYSRYIDNLNIESKHTKILKNFIKSKKIASLLKTIIVFLPIAVYRIFIGVQKNNLSYWNNNFLIFLIFFTSFSILLTLIAYILLITYKYEIKKRKIIREELEIELFLIEFDLNDLFDSNVKLVEVYEEIYFTFNQNVKFYIFHLKRDFEPIIKKYFSIQLNNKKKATTPPTIVL
ncbi:hypothetical protein SGLAD_v1c09430 [Spiroplasma gladiatoris]|uniref:Transmembrane protein n=1 Tax=Spiroplasma gladiatoris TaxID=2143 RepID=A0A4P7AIP8_9MOLU|nr:hypothetical protein [Spiroplasma gladiatoris]QBQ08142.1 hypothetical protein SGLAD_v1c09430 [Spiroplasma gladiatoris]